MTLTIEQTDAVILSTFHSMEEGVEYVLNDLWVAEMNRVRKQYNHSPLKDKKECILSRKGTKLFSAGEEVFDFNDKTNLAFALTDLAFTLSFPFAFAFTISFALQNSGIEKLYMDDIYSEHPILLELASQRLSPSP